ncbi:hypothetical protein HDV62DRAFT_363635 [Trichoderma sp. SZMC 28011]
MDLAAGSNNYKSKRAFVFFFSLLFANEHPDLFFLFFRYSPFLHLLEFFISWLFAPAIVICEMLSIAAY